MSERIGFYICHCGINIAYRVRVKEVAEYAAAFPGVAVSREYLFMCSDPGQELIEKDIKEYDLTRVVVASCSPRMHEKTFRAACQRGGLNPYYAFHMVCVREHVSWVTEDEDEATEKAIILVKAGLKRVTNQQTLIPDNFSVNSNTLIVGGGIAGMQAAIDIASSGFKAYLVEKQPTIGGHMLQYDKTFPTLDCAACIGTPKMVSVGQDPNIELLAYCEVMELSGFIGNFKVKIRKKPRYIDSSNCTGCGKCTTVCKVKYKLFPNNSAKNFYFYEIDEDSCIGCGLCARKCPQNAISGDKKKLHKINQSECVKCGVCESVCKKNSITVMDASGKKPEKLLSEWDANLRERYAVNISFPQAIPQIPVIDDEACIAINAGQCRRCEDACDAKAINFNQKEEIIEIEVGSIIVATGFDVFDPTPMTQYGYGQHANVFTNLEFERLSNATGPTAGKLLKRDLKDPLKFTDPPKSVAILHCIGSRDIKYHEYCSRTCCMYALKYAHLLKDKCGHDTEIYNFYIDMRCFGKGYEEFYNKVQAEGVRMIRGKAGSITEDETGILTVRAEDTLSGRMVEIEVEMAILCNAMEARPNAEEVTRTFGIGIGADGFFQEEHPKLAPVSTPTSGVFLAGACQGPKDIPDTVAQAKGAAAECLALSVKGEVEAPPMISYIDPDICVGCRVCIDLCPYSAIEYNEFKRVSEVNSVVCKGCGSCAGYCPSGAAKVRHFTDKQIFAEIDGLLLLNETGVMRCASLNPK
jgi:heterodisulfide reductase subunit A